jgi:hypothetical protein
MSVRVVGSVAATVLLVCGSAVAAPHAENWQAVEIVAFRDFDDLDVKLDGKPHKAFLVGLKPIRETAKGKERQKQLRDAVLAQFKKSALFAQVVTRRGEAVGLSIDAFAHHGHGFDHPWDPVKYPYCWTGWGAYNFNSYFLYTKTARYQDNLGDNKDWKARFEQVVCRMEGADRAGKLIEKLGADDFATREAASKDLKAIGGPALDSLLKAVGSEDAEVRRRALEVINAMIAEHRDEVNSLAESLEMDDVKVLPIVLNRKGQPKSAWSAPGK